MKIVNCNRCKRLISDKAYFCTVCGEQNNYLSYEKGEEYFKSESYLKERFSSFDFNTMSADFKSVLKEIAVREYQDFVEHDEYWKKYQPVVDTIEIQISTLTASLRDTIDLISIPYDATDYQRKQYEMRNDEINAKNREINSQNARLRSQIYELESKKDDIKYNEPMQFTRFRISWFDDLEDLNIEEKFEIEVLKGVLEERYDLSEKLEERKKDIKRKRSQNKRKIIQANVDKNFGEPSFKWVWHKNLSRIFGYEQARKFKSEVITFLVISIMIFLMTPIMFFAATTDDGSYFVLGGFVFLGIGGWLLASFVIKPYNNLKIAIWNHYESIYDRSTDAEYKKIEDVLMNEYISKNIKHKELIKKYLEFLRLELELEKFLNQDK
ncbi:MAG TPA: hypothetical protein GX708_01725 [Gallicola sp.]|nr:hypothetical protein [Gallicola sp.]